MTLVALNHRQKARKWAEGSILQLQSQCQRCVHESAADREPLQSTGTSVTMPSPNDRYYVGWISAVSIEMAAGRAMLDEGRGIIVDMDENDSNPYAVGRVHNH